ncbi:uncharacterized protein LOC136080150 [Hydra vulgaris]|uniref:Uncharacterized protein LOC136080150 n=1 Tax=Hydra vulgaris TaxID=6087 RepID=A0ABM4BUH8_HYDVU
MFVLFFRKNVYNQTRYFSSIEQGRRVKEIAQLLNIKHHQTVSKVIKRYQETRSYEDRVRSGRPRTSNTPANRNKILGRIKRNPRTQKNSTRKMTIAVGISEGSVQIILKEAELKARKHVTAQLLTEEMKRKRLNRCRKLLKRFGTGRHRKILFSDEKWFNVEQAHNNQNDRSWSKEPLPLEKIIISHQQKP